MVKNLPASAGDERDVCWIPRSGRSPGEGHGNPFQYSCLENPMDRGAWWTTVHRVSSSQTQLKRLDMQLSLEARYNFLKIPDLYIFPLLNIYHHSDFLEVSVQHTHSDFETPCLLFLLKDGNGLFMFFFHPKK